MLGLHFFMHALRLGADVGHGVEMTPAARDEPGVDHAAPPNRRVLAVEGLSSGDGFARGNRAAAPPRPP
ncbi:MAG: hypothetical protein AAFR79_13995, partial [Pseudomonadota bacterium]